MTPSLKNYRHPRPVWLKALGDSLLTAFGAGGACVSFFTPYPKTGAVITALGVLGSLMTNFYSKYDQELDRLENRDITVEQTTTVQQTTTVTDAPAPPGASIK